MDNLNPIVTLSGGIPKFLYDVCNILQMKFIFMQRGWYWYLLASLVFPVSTFYWARAIAPDNTDAVRRLMVGAIVFGVSLTTANILASQVIQDRFRGRLRLLVTMPMSKSAYVLAILVFGVIQASCTIALLLAFARIAGVEFVVGWAFFLLIVPVLLSMAGLALFIASYAPSAEVGGILSNLLGVVLVMISPVFFTMSQAPLLLKWIGWISPLRYAADGIMKSLSGQTNIWLEFVILFGFALITLALGVWKLRWRDR